ncbi:MAG: ATP-binding protein [Pseudomonadota bacterium]
MRHPRPKTLFLPVVGLLAAVLVLLTVVIATTYYNLDRGQEQARKILSAQATAIISGLTAGLRTGWRHWTWRPESLQGLIEEMAGSGNVAFISLIDHEGRILADSDPSRVDKSIRPIAELSFHLEREGAEGWFDPALDLFLAGRNLNPEEYGPPRRQGGGLMGPWMMRRGLLQDQALARKPELILVGLQTKSFREARKRQAQHALVMAAILFVLGSGAIYFIFVVQNYRTIDRTLSNLSTYTAGIVDNMPNGLVSLDSSGGPVMVNQAARKMFGWGDGPESSLAGEPAIAALSREFGPILKDGGTILERECDVPHPREWALPLAVSGAAVPARWSGEEGPGMVFILRDLRQIRELEGQVRQSEKLAAVGRLAAGIAHEIRNPLSSMRGLANFLGRNLDESSREAEYLKVMIEEIDRVNKVITGLLDFARPQKPDLAPVDLNKTARHTTDLITDDVRHHKISLREDMTPEKPFILADRDQAVQAMLNILLNAIEALPEGGRMTVSTKTIGNQGVFLVEDSGPGIPAELRSKLFDPFFTTKKKGSGLGLAQVATIMEAHGGTVDIGGEQGLGARVALRFPLAPPPPPSPPEDPPAQAEEPA